jgi:hypothetical protein
MINILHFCQLTRRDTKNEMHFWIQHTEISKTHLFRFLPQKKSLFLLASVIANTYQIAASIFFVWKSQYTVSPFFVKTSSFKSVQCLSVTSYFDVIPILSSNSQFTFSSLYVINSKTPQFPVCHYHSLYILCNVCSGFIHYIPFTDCQYSKLSSLIINCQYLTTNTQLSGSSSQNRACQLSVRNPIYKVSPLSASTSHYSACPLSIKTSLFTLCPLFIIFSPFELSQISVSTSHYTYCYLPLTVSQVRASPLTVNTSDTKFGLSSVSIS